MKRRRFVSASVITSTFLLSKNLFGNSFSPNPFLTFGNGFKNIWSSFKTINSNEISGKLQLFVNDLALELKKKNIYLDQNFIYMYGDNQYFIPFRSPGLLGFNNDNGMVMLIKNKNDNSFDKIVMPGSMVKCMDNYIHRVNNTIQNLQQNFDTSKLFMPFNIVDKNEFNGKLISLVYTNGYGDKFQIKKMRDFHVLSIKEYFNS